MEILPGEETPQAVPLWAWNGKYTETKQQAPAAEVQEWEGGCYTGWSAHALLTVTSTWQQHYGNTTATQFPTSKQPVTVPLQQVLLRLRTKGQGLFHTLTCHL